MAPMTIKGLNSVGARRTINSMLAYAIIDFSQIQSHTCACLHIKKIDNMPYGRDLAKASKRVAKTPFFGKFYLMWSKECVKTTTML